MMDDKERIIALEAKIDQLIGENDELRSKLEVPDGWDADTAPTYADLCRHLQAALQANAGLREELWMYYYHSNEEGKKKPTYKEWQGEAVRLKGKVRELEDTIKDLRKEVDEVCEEHGEPRRYGNRTPEGMTYEELTDEEKEDMLQSILRIGKRE